MRIEPGLILVLCLAQASFVHAAPSAGVPCVPTILADAGAGKLGRAGLAQRLVAFDLKRKGRVWVEADGLRGLDKEDPEESPEVFLDDQYLGSLLPDFGASWRSPHALVLATGGHTLLVRCAQPGGDGPVLQWASLRVLEDPACPPRRSAAGKRTSVLTLAQVKGDEPGRPCGAGRVRSDWPIRLGGRDLVLSAPGKAATDSGTLVRLSQGQVWRARMKIPFGPDGQALPLMARFETKAPDSARWVVALARSAGRRVSALGYVPGVWEPLTVSLCPGELDLDFAQVPTQRYPCSAGELSFGVAALDLGLSLAPLR